MKKARRCLVIVLIMAISCLFLVNDAVPAEAESVDFYKKYSDKSEGYIGIDEEFRLNCKCKLKIGMDVTDKDLYDFSYMTITIERKDKEYNDDDVYDYDDDPDLDDEFSLSYGPYNKTITLPAGKYQIQVDGEGEYWGDDYDMGNSQPCTYSLTLAGEYIPELSDKNITLEEGQTKTLKVKGTRKSIRWKSSNKTIASVDNKGTVKAKKAGKATITAVCGKYSLKCNVAVKKKPVSYSQLAKKMKTFARKNKGFTYKTINVGKECRLYASEVGSVDESKAQSEGYAMGTIVRPYLQLVKKNKKPELRLRIQGSLGINSLRSRKLYCSAMLLGTSNRKMRLTMKQTSGKNVYSYSTGIYYGKMEGYITISTSSKRNTSNLRKLNAMLGQKSLYVRIISRDGTFFQGNIIRKTRNEWKKLVKEYNTLLKDFK